MAKGYPEYPLEPIDSVAGASMNKGAHFEPSQKFKINTLHWENKPPKQNNNTAIQKDLRGIKFGLLTVIEYYCKGKKNTGGRWLVKCVCGHYEVRTAKAIKNPNNNGDRCCNCRWLHKKRRTQYYKTTGDELDDF